MYKHTLVVVLLLLINPIQAKAEWDSTVVGVIKYGVPCAVGLGAGVISGTSSGLLLGSSVCAAAAAVGLGNDLSNKKVYISDGIDTQINDKINNRFSNLQQELSVQKQLANQAEAAKISDLFSKIKESTDKSLSAQEDKIAKQSSQLDGRVSLIDANLDRKINSLEKQTDVKISSAISANEIKTNNKINENMKSVTGEMAAKEAKTDSKIASIGASLDANKKESMSLLGNFEKKQELSMNEHESKQSERLSAIKLTLDGKLESMSNALETNKKDSASSLNGFEKKQESNLSAYEAKQSERLDSIKSTMDNKLELDRKDVSSRLASFEHEQESRQAASVATLESSVNESKRDMNSKFLDQAKMNRQSIDSLGNAQAEQHRLDKEKLELQASRINESLAKQDQAVSAKIDKLAMETSEKLNIARSNSERSFASNSAEINKLQLATTSIDTKVDTVVSRLKADILSSISSSSETNKSYSDAKVGEAIALFKRELTAALSDPTLFSQFQKSITDEVRTTIRTESDSRTRKDTAERDQKIAEIKDGVNRVVFEKLMATEVSLRAEVMELIHSSDFINQLERRISSTIKDSMAYNPNRAASDMVEQASRKEKRTYETPSNKFDSFRDYGK
jgi:hypothetical protein